MLIKKFLSTMNHNFHDSRARLWKIEKLPVGLLYEQCDICLRVCWSKVSLTWSMCMSGEDDYDSTTALHSLCVRMTQWYDSCALILWPVVRVPPQLNFHLEWGELPALCNSRCRKHEAWLLRDEEPGHWSITKKLRSFKMSSFDV